MPGKTYPPKICFHLQNPILHFINLIQITSQTLKVWSAVNENAAEHCLKSTSRLTSHSWCRISFGGNVFIWRGAESCYAAGSFTLASMGQAQQWAWSMYAQRTDKEFLKRQQVCFTAYTAPRKPPPDSFFELHCLNKLIDLKSDQYSPKSSLLVSTCSRRLWLFSLPSASDKLFVGTASLLSLDLQTCLRSEHSTESHFFNSKMRGNMGQNQLLNPGNYMHLVFKFKSHNKWKFGSTLPWQSEWLHGGILGTTQERKPNSCDMPQWSEYLCQSHS